MMKIPAKVSQKSKPAKMTKNGGVNSSTMPDIDISQMVNSLSQLANATMGYASEKERTEQVKAQSLRDMHLSNNEVEIALRQQSIRHDELITERMVLENSRQKTDKKHEEWMRDYEMREKTIELLRERIRQGVATVADLEMLERLHTPSSDQ
ncbi:hypothetical protein [Morganella morganii]|uniref:Uncharacterized protein n=1 Tax=Morganella morganii TaxID=582 RepID=A0A0D8LDB3_MORMO|nr:hypothetical protein UA45_01500 [Morganella morganii]